MNLDYTFSKLIQDGKRIFVCNLMKANPDKFQFIILGNTGSHALKIGDITIKSASSVYTTWYYY